MGYKLNSDGCSRGNLGLSRGGLLWDRQGNFIFGYSYCSGNLMSLHAVLRALLLGIWQCISRGYYELHIGADSLIRGGCKGSLRSCSCLNNIFKWFCIANREANKRAGWLTNLGGNSSIGKVFDSFMDLPWLVRGDVKLDRLGFPSFHRRICWCLFVWISCMFFF